MGANMVVAVFTTFIISYWASKFIVGHNKEHVSLTRERKKGGLEGGLTAASWMVCSQQCAKLLGWAGLALHPLLFFATKLRNGACMLNERSQPYCCALNFNPKLSTFLSLLVFFAPLTPHPPISCVPASPRLALFCAPDLCRTGIHALLHLRCPAAGRGARGCYVHHAGGATGVRDAIAQGRRSLGGRAAGNTHKIKKWF